VTHKRHGVVCRGESICYRDAQMGTPCSYSRASPPAAALQWGRGAAARIKFSFSSGPNTAAARVDPRRPDDPVVGNTAHDGGVAIGRQRDGVALSGTSNRVCADQLIGLLGPDSPAAAVDPRSTCATRLFFAIRVTSLMPALRQSISSSRMVARSKKPQSE
jgi:hypothetical protein